MHRPCGCRIDRLAEAEESAENLSESYFSEIARDPLFADPAIFASA